MGFKLENFSNFIAIWKFRRHFKGKMVDLVVCNLSHRITPYKIQYSTFAIDSLLTTELSSDQAIHSESTILNLNL